MLITFDYLCEKCQTVKEIIHPKGETQFCIECGTELKKQVSTTKVAHISWSTWRVSANL